MKPCRSQISKAKGLILVEFCMVFPCLLIMMLLVLEISTLMADKNLLNATTAQSARYALKYMQSLNPAPQSDDMKEQDCPDELKEALRLRLAFRMSLASPRASVLIDEIVTEVTQYQLPSFESLGFHVSFLNFLTNMMDGYIVARWLNIAPPPTCTFSKEGVSVGMQFFRRVRIPYAGDLLWLTYFLNYIAKKYQTTAEIGDDFYGLTNVKNTYLDTLYDELQKRVEAQKAKISTLETQLFSKIPYVGSALKEQFDKLGLIAKIDSEIDKAMGVVKDYKDKAEGMVDKTLTRYATMIVQMIPEEARVIPIQKTISRKWAHQNIANFNGEDFSGWVMPLAPYMLPPDKLSDDEQIWLQWMQKLVKYDKEEWKTNSDYLTNPEN